MKTTNFTLNIQDIKNLDYEDEESMSRYFLNKKSGIFIILCDKEIFHIGKSTDLLKRFVGIKNCVLFPEMQEKITPKDKVLNEKIFQGVNISLKVIELCSHHDLDDRLDYYKHVQYGTCINKTKILNFLYKILNNTLKNKNDIGIYGIYIKNELVYIGMSESSLKSRLETHIKQIVYNHEIDDKYTYFKENYKELEFKIIEQLENNEINQSKIRDIEKHYIQLYKPRFNIQHNS